MCIICCSGQLWFLSPTEDDVDITKRLTPGPSNAGYLVNKRFSDRGDTKSKIFQDPEVKKAKWTIPSHNKKGAVTREETDENLAVKQQTNGKNLLTVSKHQYHTPSREERRFFYFNHLSKEFLEHLIPHLKALI